MAGETWSEGRTVNAAKGVPGSVTDCSGWESDIPEHLWSEGRTVNAAKGVPGSVTDCSNWGQKAPAWIVVHARYAADTPPAVVATYANAVLEALQALAPDLGLEYDEARSAESTVERTVTIVISPTVLVGDLRARLTELVPQVFRAGLKVPVTGLTVKWDDSAQPLAA